jgi:2-keto-4-pentenoate hydratase
VSADELESVASCVLADYDAKTPGRVLGPPSALTIAQAYAIQAEVGRLREERGERIIGYKVGCTSKPIQRQLGVEEPIFGRIFDTGTFRSGARLSHGCFANLAVEGELAVRLGDDLSGPDAAEQACRDAIEAVFPVIELHNYVIPGAWPALQWLIASSGMHAGFVFEEPSPDRSDLAIVADSLRVQINDVTVGAVVDSESLIRPIESLQWLVRRLSHFGLQLQKDQVILTGSPLPLYPVAAPSRIIVEAPPLGASWVEVSLGG